MNWLPLINMLRLGQQRVFRDSIMWRHQLVIRMREVEKACTPFHHSNWDFEPANDVLMLVDA